MNIFPRPLVFFCIILNGCMVFCLWMCIIYVTVFFAKILDSLLCFTLRSLTTANFSCHCLHAHAWFLRINSQERTGWLKVRASVVRSWDHLDRGKGWWKTVGQDRQERVVVARVLVKVSPSEVRRDINGGGSCHHSSLPWLRCLKG